MLFKECGSLNIAARHNNRSTSFPGPENDNDAKWLVISLVHDIRGTTWTSFFLSRLSEPQIPPTNDLKEQQTSITKEQLATIDV